MKKVIIIALAGLAFSTSAISAPWEYKEGKDYVDQEVRRSNEYTLEISDILSDEIHETKTKLHSVDNKVIENQRESASQAIAAERNSNSYTDLHINRASTYQTSYTDVRFNEMNSKVSKLDEKVDNNRKHSSAGISSVAAMSSIPFNSNQTFAIGMGWGAHDGERALAFGANWNINETVSVRTTMAHDSVSEKTYGAGVVFGW